MGARCPARCPGTVTAGAPPHASVQSSRAAASSVAEATRRDRDPGRTVKVVRAIYRNLPDDVRLWATKGEFVLIDQGAVAHALGTVEKLAG